MEDNQRAAIGSVLLRSSRRGELVEALGLACLVERDADGGEARTQRSL